jgi:hypothetical protein
MKEIKYSAIAMASPKFGATPVSEPVKKPAAKKKKSKKG